MTFRRIDNFLTLMPKAVLWNRSFFRRLWLSGQIVVVITSNALLIKGIHSIGQPEKSYTASKHWPKGSISSTKNCKMPRLLLNICPVSGQNICEQKLYSTVYMLVYRCICSSCDRLGNAEIQSSFIDKFYTLMYTYILGHFTPIT